MSNAVCRLCDLDRGICSCRPAPPAEQHRRLFPTDPAHYWRDQYDPRDNLKESTR